MLKSVAIYIAVLSILSFAHGREDYRYVYPTPGARRVAVESCIIIRLHADASLLSAPLEKIVRVMRSASQEVFGTISIASDEKTIIFTPESNFEYDEEYSVQVNPNRSFESFAPFSFQFKTIAESNSAPDFQMEDERVSSAAALQKPMNSPRIMPNGVSVPGDFPHINVATNKHTADGYIFINNWRNEGPYNIIFANDGSPASR